MDHDELSLATLPDESVVDQVVGGTTTRHAAAMPPSKPNRHELPRSV
jgi:hypothetical protein